MKNDWVKMPSSWIIEQKKLKELKWENKEKSDSIASLIIYIIFLHYYHLSDNKPDFSITYNKIKEISGLSKAKISGGIKKLQLINLLKVKKNKKSNVYEIEGINNNNWAKMPFKKLYCKQFAKIEFFEHFKLRSKNELNALKLYLLIVSFRDIETNSTKITYDKICDYTGIFRNEISFSISFLINLRLINVDTEPSQNYDGSVNVYRISHIEPYNHRGTVSRKSI
jgi:hypothetical protein